ncbi:MAG: alpha/beta fold hydrolase [Sulfuriferula sp.]|nr:alpha/beta fold hydrolase [Sulfuriferula sp.]
MSQPPIELLAGTAEASIILLHGLGANGFDLAPVAQALNLPGIRFILPHAEARPVTINGGYVMPAWYDISHSDISQDQDEIGFANADAVVTDLIQREIARGIDSKKIVLAGFSQGGAVALHCGLTSNLPLAGIVALSAYLPHFSGGINPTPRIWAAHGDHDDVIPLSLSRNSYTRLPQTQLEMHTYPMAHEISMDEIADLRAWLMALLN